MVVGCGASHLHQAGLVACTSAANSRWSRPTIPAAVVPLSHSHSLLSIVDEAALLPWHHYSLSRLRAMDTTALRFAMEKHNAAKS